ncbi:uracil phosphoribosyltransferase [Streptomyces sp. NPDC053048]|uniref:uracil phosphoribosyltransferase n=1 Tax=Streptomyces sp. NPDC053048 TaxID=3365694 RepID=UPI0037CE17A8
MTLPADITEITDDGKQFARLRHATDPGEVRRGIIELGDVLGPRTADIVRNELVSLQDVLCVVVLRGGALLYPGFARAFPWADFCMLGMRRRPEPGGNRLSPANEYMTTVPREEYRATVYIDCVSATGDTLLAARNSVARMCDGGREVAAVVCSAGVATARLRGAGIGLVGFSLHEDLDGQVVVPDMGELDAGDLFSGVPRHPAPGGHER